MARIDVTIMGAGIFGLSIAWECLRRGANVQVIDPAGPGAGASGGVLGALAPHTPENWNPKKEFQLKSLLAADTFWEAVDQTSGISSGYGRTGRLQPLHDERAVALARQRQATAKYLWRGQACWTLADARDYAGWLPATKTGLAVLDTLTGRINPAKACKSLAQALVRQGATIQPEGRPKGPVVWATGYSGLPDLGRHLEQPVGSGVKGQAALLALDLAQMPQIFAEALHFIPHADGTVAVGSTSERDFDLPDSTNVMLDQLLDRAGTVVPAIAGARVIQRWAGVRPRANTRAPMLGEWPGRPGHFVANGGFKIGLGIAPEVANKMADLVLDQNDTIPEGFRVVDNLKS